MLAVLVGPGGEVGADRHGAVGDTGQGQVSGAQRAGSGADGGPDLPLARHPQRGGDLGELGGLDRVQFVVPTHQERHQPARDTFGGGHHQGLDGALDRLPELGHQVGDGTGVRGIRQPRLLRRCRWGGCRGQGLGQLHVGGIVAGGGEGDGIFAR